MNAIIFVFLALISQVYSQDIVDGVCNPVETLTNFDGARYAGVWYEIERIDYPSEANLICVSATYTQQNATTFGVQNYGVHKVFGKGDTIKGIAFIPDVSQPNKLLVRLRIEFNGQFLGENTSDYNVIETDYDNYALVYSCRPVSSQKNSK